MATVKVEGLRETVRDLKRLGVEVNDMKSVFHSIGQEVAKDAKANAPVRTGKLQSNIRAARRQNMARITSTTPYNVYQHFGTKYIAANPYMFEAVDQNEAWVVKRLTSELDKLVSRFG